MTDRTAEPLSTILRIAEMSITVADLAVRELWYAEPTWPAERAASEMQRMNLDYAPLREEPVRRYVDRSELEGQTVADHAMPIDASHLVSGDLSLADGLTVLAERRFFFVIERDRIVGIVGLADLQRPPVSMVTFALILAAEAGMNRLIDVTFPDERWLPMLGDRRERVEDVFRNRQRRNAEITRLECLMLEDRLRLLDRAEEIRAGLGFTSRTAFRDWGEKLKRLRDPLAHGGSVLDAEPDLDRALALIRRVRGFAVDVWTHVARSLSGGHEVVRAPAQAPDIAHEELERSFHRAMVSIYERAKAEAGYTATRFIQMVSERGGLAAARTLLHASTVSDGFTELWERGRLDLTVERHVLEPEFKDLFTDEERRIAADRLRAYGMEITDS